MKARKSMFLMVMAAIIFPVSAGVLAADSEQRTGTTERHAVPGISGSERPMRPGAAETKDVGREAGQVQEEKKGKEAAEAKSAERISEPMGTSMIKDAKVKNDQGEDLGTVSDLIVDPTGRVDFLIVSGAGRKVAVPYRAFGIIPEKRGEKVIFVLNLNKEQLGRAPDYRDDPRIFTDQERTADIYRFYGIQPDSREGSVIRHERSEQTGENPSEYGKQKEEAPQGPMGATKQTAPPEGQK
jgi:sporulation protein YlmC with PRC-barrel domain